MKVTELRAQLAQRQREATEIIKEAGPDRKYSQEMLTNLRSKNDEMNRLGSEIDSHVEAERLETAVKARENSLEVAEKGMVLPGTQAAPLTPAQVAAATGSVGQMFFATETYKQFMSSKSARTTPETVVEAKHLFPKANPEYKAPLTTTLSGTTLPGGYSGSGTTTQWQVYPQYLPGVTVPLLYQRPVVADLIPQGNTISNSIVYMVESSTGSVNGAATVVEGALKPESALNFTQSTVAVTKIATVLPVTEELLQDQPAAQAYIDNRLRLFLALSEEAQLINGNGTFPNIRGILQTSGHQVFAMTSNPGTPGPDVIFMAMTAIRVNSFLEPTGIIMHPNNWRDIRLLRTADGIYIWGSPSDTAQERLWGMNIVQTPSMPVGTAIVGAFDTASQIFRRTEVGFAISDQHADFFQRNMLMLKVEERLAFVVYRPAAFAEVNGL